MSPPETAADPMRSLAASFMREAEYLNNTAGPYGLSRLTEDDWLALLAQSEFNALLSEARAAGVARYEAALRSALDWLGHGDTAAAVYELDRAIHALAAPLAEQRNGLDVERLAAALRAQHDAFLQEPESFDTDRQVAEAIAAEYARLTPSRPAEERKP